LLKIKISTFKYWKGMGEKYIYKSKISFTRSYIPLEYLYSIIKFLKNKEHKEYTIKSIEKNTISFKSKGGKPIHNPRFPINFETKEGAILVSALLCDGGIDKMGNPLYNNSEICMRKRVVKAINKLIGKIHTNPIYPQKNNCLIFPKTIKDILINALNMQIGDKVINNPKIPDIFLDTNKKEVIGAFLNQAFSDDGSAYTTKKYNQGTIAYGSSIDVSMFRAKFIEKIKKEKLTDYASNLVKGCTSMLKKLNIKVNGPYAKPCYLRHKGGKKRIIMPWTIQIQGRDNVKKFKELIGFSILRKNKKIDEILNNYKEVDYGKSFEISWKIVTKLNSNKIPNQLDNFAKKYKSTREYSRQLLKNLRKKGIIKRNGGGYERDVHSCIPYKYKLIKPHITS